MPSGGGASGSTQTIQKADPWEGQQEYLKEALKASQGLFNDPTAQYDNDAFNQAMQTWNTANAGQTPQYDNAAYQQALTAYNAQPTGAQADPLGLGAWRKTPEASQYTKSADVDRAYNAYTSNFKPSTGQSGTAPTLDQYLIPGVAGPKPKLEQFVKPGTSGTALTPKAFPDQTFANFAPETLTAQNLISQRAQAGSPLTNKAQGYLGDVLNGSYLNSNPHLDATFNKAADQIQGRVNSAFGTGGRFGSGINQEVMGRTLADAATGIYGQNYTNERNAMQQGLLFAPELANQDYVDMGQLANVGAQKEGQAQLSINDQINRFNLENEAPLTALQRYQQLISGNFGGTTTATSPYYQNSAGNALGMGLGGMSMLSGLNSMGGGGMLGGLFGGGTAAAAGASTLPWLTSAATTLPWLASDSRLKTDITHIGQERGFPIYTFRYRADPDAILYRGVMAQDVMWLNPGAVRMDGDYMEVNYNAIGIEFARVH